MFHHVAQFALLVLLTVQSDAFKLLFHDNDQCAGEFLGSWIGGVNQGCRQDFVGVAQSVTVLSTGAVDDAYTVKFYDSSDCGLGTEVAVADGGCLTIDSVTVHGYRSFNVVLNSIDTPTAKKPRAETGIMGLARRQQDFIQPHISHGDFATFHGIEYRWQQVSATGWLGILPHEWNEDIHFPTNKTLDLDPDLLAELDIITAARTKGASREPNVEERGLVDGVCKVTASCISTAQQGQAVVVAAVLPWLTQALAVVNTRRIQLNDFLNDNPFIAQVVIPVGATLIQVKMGGQSSGDNENIGDCSNVAAGLSDLAKSLDAMASAIESLAAAASSKSLTASIQDTRAGGDLISTLTVTVLACGQLPTTTGCGGIDAGFCIA